MPEKSSAPLLPAPPSTQPTEVWFGPGLLQRSHVLGAVEAAARHRDLVDGCPESGSTRPVCRTTVVASLSSQ